MNETARNLWRIARELPRGDIAALLTTAASVWIVLLAASAILRRILCGIGRAWGWLRGGREAVDEDQFPEGA